MRRLGTTVIALAALFVATSSQAQPGASPPPQPPGASPPPQPPGTTCWGFGCDQQAPAPPAPPPQPAPTYQTAPATEAIPGPVGQPPPPPSSSPAQAQPQPAPSRPDDDDEDARPDKRRASVKLEMGGSYRRLFDYDIAAMDIGGGVGARGRTMGHFFSAHFYWGETAEHLRTYGTTLGYNLELYFADIIRFGLGAEFGFMWIRRASLDSRLFTVGAGVFVHGGLDLVKLSDDGYRAFYVDARLQGGVYIENAPQWGPTLSLGFRF